SATALLKYGKQNYLDFDLQTNPFQLNEMLPILSAWQQYRPRGKVQAHVKGSGNPGDFSAMDYNGDIQMNGFSFQPGEKTKPVNNLNGTIAFRGNSLETTSITARYGDSLLTLKGKIRSLKNPEAEITLSSPDFFLRDATPNSARSDAIIRKLRAVFTIREGLYSFQSISGLLNTSDFNISGTYMSGLTNEANISITSTRLDLNDLKLFKSLTTPNGGRAGSAIAAKIKLDIEAGNYGRLQFNKLNATIQQENGILYLLGTSVGIFDGQLSAKGRIASGGEQGDRYDLALDLVKADAEKLFTALDFSREVTGSLTLHGDLTASGDSLAEIKKTALGNVKLQMNNGKLRKFNTLSKVFSILNVSQLLKFHLPDMVTGGMPYNNITGSISIKDGSVSSQDLFISSDAINISVVGSADVVKEELNFTIGVQPLQTVDKIVNRIPVVGWLLTGKDKNFLTAYFEAKGKWSNPQVSAIPVKSISKGILNIFKRVFELPVRLFTDTGEVILGQ
ncbi:MAG: AsmA-like C-terminal domain-containing protein, partial [Deltaproteobacteria bacterium]